MGEAAFVLGIEIKRDRERKALGLCQRNYIDRVLKRFAMETCKAGESPMSKGDKLHSGQCPKNSLEKKEMDKRPYARLVGSLMYAQVCTRPDIAFSVGVLARYKSNPGNDHWVAGKKVLRYLQKTKDYMLVYRRIEDQDLEIIGYTYSDYKGCIDDLKSTSRYIYMLAGGAISWRSVKQSLTATSTMHAEYAAIHDATAAVFFAKNNKRSTTSRNIDVKYYAVRESVRNNEIEIIKIGTLAQLADPFTKAIAVAPFQVHVKNMGVLENFDMAE
ncbi:secreted RxLR effector protein 161-like [Rosa rugosa]|uniref:secreted RxLR effector protein 161-like n=1 Tax=Rosa rugosa TaxID=74645 RepID=UPI002B40AD7D|nr:secreted RxLR effector protein 161-like [Rosa rugosa]